MARIETIRMVDDLTGEQAEETVQFAVDGVAYEIELTSHNAATLREAVATYIGAARRGQATTGRRRRAGTGTPASTLSTERREHNNAIRAWARQHGYPVRDRGRIAGHIVDAYQRQAGRTGAPAPRPADSTDSATVQFQTAD